MKLLIDMNLTPRWVGALVSAGHDAVHWSDAGAPDVPDDDRLKYARNGDYVLITNDLDISGILAHTTDGKPSVILLRGEVLTPERHREALIRILAECSSQLNAGAILAPDLSDTSRARLLSAEA